jgi:hypothetical protein
MGYDMFLLLFDHRPATGASRTGPGRRQPMRTAQVVTIRAAGDPENLPLAVPITFDFERGSGSSW